ncbi:MAG: hypothetical protein JXA68_06125 [Ignavibacteriales bacterium]|nr:hypothetical protein [Ignavibacteriales bacterium]
MKKVFIISFFIVITSEIFSQYNFCDNHSIDSNNTHQEKNYSLYTQFLGGVITGLAIALPFNMFAKDNFSDISDKFTYMYLGYTLGSTIGICLFSNELDFSSGLLTLLGSGIGGVIGYFTNSVGLALLFPPAFGLAFNNYFTPNKYDNSNGFSFKVTELSQIIPNNNNLMYQLNFSYGF